MATFQIAIDDEKIQDLLQSDQGVASLLGPILYQILDAGMAEPLQPAPNEHTDWRRGYRNRPYTRQLTTCVGTLDLDVPRDREGTFQTRPFNRYPRPEKALVLALIQMVVQGVSMRRVKKVTTELSGREFTRRNDTPTTSRLIPQSSQNAITQHSGLDLLPTDLLFGAFRRVSAKKGRAAQNKKCPQITVSGV